jgi:two-component system, OmpR family, phosphate regulon sensor histidine kinase PhoR
VDDSSQCAPRPGRFSSWQGSKDRIITALSHDLRTPLTSISGYAELLAEGDVGELTLAQEQVVAAIRRNAARLEELVHQLVADLAGAEDQPGPEPESPL